jgi:hypothetical protein
MQQFQEEILSRREAASYLGICLTLLDRSSIPRSKIGKRVLFQKSVLNKYLEEQTVATQPIPGLNNS